MTEPKRTLKTEFHTWENKPPSGECEGPADPDGLLRCNHCGNIVTVDMSPEAIAKLPKWKTHIVPEDLLIDDEDDSPTEAPK